jgi:polygalacturonase
VILIPKGRWLTGPIQLQSNINLHLSKDAELLFSQDRSDYLPVVFSRHEDIECYKYSAFIYAEGKTNIAITGEGTLNGQGKPWWEMKEAVKESLLAKMVRENVPVKERVFDGTDGKELRPAFFQPMSCKEILVEGVTFLYGAFWTITPTYCENVIVRNVHIVTEGSYGHTPNGDGVDPSSCKNVLIEHCEFDTGDDCIAIKSGRDADGLRVGKSTENIVIRDCSGLRGHGGIVIGSETSGGVKNVYAENCRFKGTDRIVRIKSARGRGGIIESLWFKNISGEEIKNEAIHLNMLYTGNRLPAQEVTATTPVFRNIHFENITCLSGKSYAIELLGIPEMRIENISFDGITTNTQKGINFSDVKGVQVRNSTITAKNKPLFNITDGMDISVDSVKFSGSGEEMLVIDGEQSRNISFLNTNIPDTGKAVTVGAAVSRETIHIGK